MATGRLLGRTTSLQWLGVISRLVWPRSPPSKRTHWYCGPMPREKVVSEKYACNGLHSGNDLDRAPNETLAPLGPNLLAPSNLMLPPHGRLEHDDQDQHRHDHEAKARAGRIARRRPFASAGHCGVMPDSLTTFSHLTNSDSINLLKSAVLILMISAPSFASCACISGADCTSPIVLWSFSMIEVGMPAGAMMPHQFAD